MQWIEELLDNSSQMSRQNMSENTIADNIEDNTTNDTSNIPKKCSKKLQNRECNESVDNKEIVRSRYLYTQQKIPKQIEGDRENKIGIGIEDTQQILQPSILYSTVYEDSEDLSNSDIDTLLDEEDEVVCQICCSSAVKWDNEIQQCDGPCGGSFHQNCANVTTIPDDEWYCSTVCRLASMSCYIGTMGITSSVLDATTPTVPQPGRRGRNKLQQNSSIQRNTMMQAIDDKTMTDTIRNARNVNVSTTARKNNTEKILQEQQSTRVNMSNIGSGTTTATTGDDIPSSSSSSSHQRKRGEQHSIRSQQKYALIKPCTQDLYDYTTSKIPTDTLSAVATQHLREYYEIDHLLDRGVVCVNYSKEQKEQLDFDDSDTNEAIDDGNGQTNVFESACIHEYTEKCLLSKQKADLNNYKKKSYAIKKEYNNDISTNDTKDESICFFKTGCKSCLNGGTDWWIDCITNNESNNIRYKKSQYIDENTLEYHVRQPKKYLPSGNHTFSDITILSGLKQLEAVQLPTVVPWTDNCDTVEIVAMYYPEFDELHLSSLSLGVPQVPPLGKYYRWEAYERTQVCRGTIYGNVSNAVY